MRDKQIATADRIYHEWNTALAVKSAFLSKWVGITNTPIKIEFVVQLSTDVEQRMRNDLVEYEHSHAYKYFAITLSNEEHRVIGAQREHSSF